MHLVIQIDFPRYARTKWRQNDDSDSKCKSQNFTNNCEMSETAEMLVLVKSKHFEWGLIGKVRCFEK